MKKLFTYILTCFVTMCCFAQNNDYVFSTKSGENFTIFINNIKINDTPKSNVKVENINGNSLSLKIVFDGNNEVFTKNIYNENDNCVLTYTISRNNKGEVMVLPKDAVVKNNAVTVTEEYVEYEAVEETKSHYKGNHYGNRPPMPPHNGNRPPMSPQNGYNHHHNNGHHGHNEGFHSSNSNCRTFISDDVFKQAVESIKSQNFDDKKLTVAKQVCSKSCISAEQVVEIMKLFSFEEKRLDFAKYAYNHCYNQEVYFIVNDGFSFSSSIDKLNEYIEKN